MFGFRSSFSAPSGLRGAHRAPSLPKPTGTEIVPAELYEAHKVKSYLRQAQNTWLVRRDGTQTAAAHSGCLPGCDPGARSGSRVHTRPKLAHALANCAVLTVYPSTVSEPGEPAKGDSPMNTYHSFSQSTITRRLPH